jgi:hypothetical protein
MTFLLHCSYCHYLATSVIHGKAVSRCLRDQHVIIDADAEHCERYEESLPAKVLRLTLAANAHKDERDAAQQLGLFGD